MDDTTRSIIRNVKGPGTLYLSPPCPQQLVTDSIQKYTFSEAKLVVCIVREDDILCLLESEREARRLR